MPTKINEMLSIYCIAIVSLLLPGGGSSSETNVPPEDYRLTSRIPAGCTPTVDCSYFVGIRTNTNSSFLDIYLEGDAQGWVAVGFSTTPNMFSADVLGCNRMEQTDEVFVVDTWNPASPTRNNVLDPNQDGVYPHSTAYANGSISCSFSRFVGVLNPNQDLDLYGDYFFLFGRGPTGGGNGSFPYHHRPDPTISNSRANPVISVGKVGVDTVSANLIRAHGILMIIAYPVLVVTAIFIVTWMKPALPNGEWFQIHRAFMIASLFIAALGFVLIFVAFRDHVTPGLIDLTRTGTATGHFAIGVTVIVLHILNPIIAAFRPKPESKMRGIFKLVHGTLIGQVVQTLATTNVGLGLLLFGPFYSRFADLTIFGVYIAYTIIFTLLVFTLVFIFMILPRFRAKKDESAVRLTKVMSTVSDDNPLINEEANVSEERVTIDPDPPSKDVRCRWIALGVFLAIMIPFMFVTIVLVALPLQ